jgi:hypothetical protein
MRQVSQVVVLIQAKSAAFALNAPASLGLRLAGEPVPEPGTQAGYCEVAAWWWAGRIPRHL